MKPKIRLRYIPGGLEGTVISKGTIWVGDTPYCEGNKMEIFKTHYMHYIDLPKRDFEVRGQLFTNTLSTK
jgi:hypothetical protein